MSNIYKPGTGGGGGGGITTISGDTGSITGTSVTVFSNRASNNSGASVFFSNTGTISTLNLTDTNNNTWLGKSAGAVGLTGTGNFGGGFQAGSAYSGAETNNILLRNLGVNGENNTIRIGTQGTQTRAFIAGVSGVTLTTPQITTVSSTGQIGSVPFATFIQNITSSSINFKNTGVTTIFTTTSNFLITNIIYYGMTVTGSSAGFAADFGWTSPNFSDFTTPNLGTLSFQVSASGQYQPAAGLSGGTALPIIPTGQPFSINIKTADTTATTDLGVIIIQGMYVT